MSENDPNIESSPSAQSSAAGSTGPLSLSGMMKATVRHNWRVSLSVALGVATATSVIVGALLVGDSMRGSLRGLTTERLGKIESVVIPGGFFGDDVAASPDLSAVPLILFAAGVVESQGDAAVVGSIRRAGSVQIVGCDADFWDLDVTGVRPEHLPDDNGVVLNESLATEIGVKVGDLVTVRMPVEQAVPADSPLGRRDIQSEGLPRMEVLDIVPDRGLGRFAISPSQAAPQNVFVARATVADVLQREGQANTLLFDRDVAIDDLAIDLPDLGLDLKRVRHEFRKDENADPTVIIDYYSLTSDRLLLPELVVDRVGEQYPERVAAVTTYLANAIERLDESGEVVASVPYSTIAAMDPTPALPLDFEATSLSEDVVPLVINRWTADRLDASEGTALRIAYYEPEVENGKEIERYFDAVVTGIVPITKPATPYRLSKVATFDQPPTVYNDPDLTPSVPGVTDQDSISDWDLPFKLTRKIPPEDDTYWKEHRLTPKAFLPLDDGRRLFGSRFGQTTGLRIDPEVAEDIDQLRGQIQQAIQPILGELGWSVRPIRQQQLAASRGTTPFDALFLSLSFFVILSAVMLIAMLFRLGLIERLTQFGTLLAVGWTPRRVATLALGEGLIVAAVGVVVGVLGGVIYAVLVLWALRSWWVGAVTVPFLTFHWTATSLLGGAVAGWLVAAITLSVTVRSLMKVGVQSLLSGRDTDQQSSSATQSEDRPARLNKIAAVTTVLAVIIAALGAIAGGQAAAGGFVGGGMLLLLATLMTIYARLRRPRRIRVGEPTGHRYSIGSLAARNASRHPLRSTLTIGLMATAAFLIIAITAFRLQPTERGTGGFELVAQSAQSLSRDLSDRQVQSELLGPDAAAFEHVTLVPIRLRVGHDASCNNLYQAIQPTVLGMPGSFAETLKNRPETLPGFDWAATAELAEDQSPWDLLSVTAAGTEEDPIPMIVDQNTAMWSLKIGMGKPPTAFEYETGKPIYFEVVGMLANSLLQGKLMIGESNFENLFTDISGYRFFLIDSDQQSELIASTLESRLGDIGMDVSDSKSVLSGLLAVQNTYLRTFQTLGGLGLLLGTIGLAVSQLRSVLERRQELAVLRVFGFTRKRLAAVVLSETASLLLAGIGCGAVCAVLAVLPYAVLSGLSPPIIEPLLIVLGIIVFGMFAGLLAVSRVVRMPLMESLRSE